MQLWDLWTSKVPYWSRVRLPVQFIAVNQNWRLWNCDPMEASFAAKWMPFYFKRFPCIRMKYSISHCDFIGYLKVARYQRLRCDGKVVIADMRHHRTERECVNVDLIWRFVQIILFRACHLVCNVSSSPETPHHTASIQNQYLSSIVRWRITWKINWNSIIDLQNCRVGF